MTNEEAIFDLEQFALAPVGDGDLHRESVEIALSALREQAKRENPKPPTNLNVLFGAPEEIADILLPMLPTMEGFCPYCKHWIDDECKVNPKWDCKNALVNWLNQPYVDKPKEAAHE